MWEIFGKAVCPNCEEAKEILKSAGIEYEYQDAEEALELTPGWRTRQTHLIRAYNEYVDGNLPFIRHDGNWVTLEELKGMYEEKKK